MTADLAAASIPGGVRTAQTAQSRISSPAQDDFYDLGDLLSSLQVRELAKSRKADVFSNVWAPEAGQPVRSFGFSLGLHGVAVLMVYVYSFFSYGGTVPITRADLERDYEITYYRPSEDLPHITSSKDGPKDPAGEKKGKKPPKGSTAFHPTQNIQSSPPKADNRSQTIVQPETPEIRIQKEIKVPNMVAWNIPAPKLESIDIASRSRTPLIAPQLEEARLRAAAPDAESVRRELSSLDIESGMAPDQQIPEAIPVAASPEWKLGETGQVRRSLSSLAFNGDPINGNSRGELDLPSAASPEWAMADATNVKRALNKLMAGGEGTISSDGPALPTAVSPEWTMGSPGSGNADPLVDVPGASSGHLRNIVALSANPGLPGPETIQVPPGNRTGAFSISPDGNRAGSPDGTDGGTLGGGVAGGGGRGGSPDGFGSGGDIAQIQIPGLSVEGGPFSQGPSVARPGRRPRSPSRFTEMQVIEDPGESYSITVVEGRQGGAGLGVYGVLAGKRNYTVFVPMPAGRWTMQFSQRADAPVESSSGQPRVVVSAGDVLIQPRPLRKVDPGRPEDEDLARIRGMVVLYAIIRTDGQLDKMRVVRSLNPALDDRAMDALEQWKFKPAQLAGRSVEVEALFGIPFRPPRR